MLTDQVESKMTDFIELRRFFMENPTVLLCLIVAKSLNNVIGANGKLPWRQPTDLAHFKAVTLDHPVIMGRKTYQSIGRSLPGRFNVVISRTADQGIYPQPAIARSLLAALNFLKFRSARLKSADLSKVFIIGGSEVYALAFPWVSELYVTDIDAEVEGDAYFEHDLSGFEVTSLRYEKANHLNEHGMWFKTYSRRKPQP